MTTIEVVSTDGVDHFFLEDLHGVKTKQANNKPFVCSSDWHLLTIPYTGNHIEITDVKVNNESIKHLIYTGYFRSNVTNKLVMPCTSVYEAGEFRLWIHPNLGYMMFTLFNQINNGDYGTNLFDTYLHTVDRPIMLRHQYPTSIESFFTSGVGPRWWRKDSESLPYYQLDNIDLGKSIPEIINECHDLLAVQTKDVKIKSWDGQSLALPNNDPTRSPEKADAIDLKDRDWHGLEKLFSHAGYAKMLAIHYNVLQPGKFFRIHRDDYPSSKNLSYISGPKKLYYNWTNQKHQYLKLGEVGIIPMDRPVMVNTQMYSHAAINDSDVDRPALVCYGIMKEDLVKEQNNEY
jgi:hypothetical protein